MLSDPNSSQDTFSLELNPIDNTPSADPFFVRLEKLEDQGSGASNVYKASGSEGQPVFLTSTKSCSPGLLKMPLLALSRQLLIGFDKISKRDQRPLNNNPNDNLFVEWQALLEEEKFEIQTYLYRQGECVVDITIWYPEISTSPIRPFELASQLAEQLLPRIK